MPATEAEWLAIESRNNPRPMWMRGSGAISVRRVLYRAQYGTCALCGLPLEERGRTIDHVVPRARQGMDRIGNLVLSHMLCNGMKADRLPTGCELIWLLAVNNRLGVEPSRW